MSLEMGLWRVDGESPLRLRPSPLPMEKWLEGYLEADPMLLGDPLLLIGRQVPTAYGTYIDLLGMDAEGSVHVLELKRDKTPREVIAQVLDYGQWVWELTRDDIIALARDYLGRPLEEAFAERFGIAPPDDLNDSAHLTVVASELDPSSERIVNYLRTSGVLINAVFFAHLEDGDRRYLARTWLASSGEEVPGSPIKRGGKRANWNGFDWFISFGDSPTGRSWSDGLRYGFVCAGGGKWFTQTLRRVPVGARVNVHLPGRGYVAVGQTIAEAAPMSETSVESTALSAHWRCATGRATTTAGARVIPTGKNCSPPSDGPTRGQRPRLTGRLACSPIRTAPADSGSSSRSSGSQTTSGSTDSSPDVSWLEAAGFT